MLNRYFITILLSIRRGLVRLGNCLDFLGILCSGCCLCILDQCADGQADLLLLLVDVDDLDLDLFADFKDIGGLCNAGLGNLRNVNQTVRAGHDLIHISQISKCRARSRQMRRRA